MLAPLPLICLQLHLTVYRSSQWSLTVCSMPLKVSTLAYLIMVLGITISLPVFSWSARLLDGHDDNRHWFCLVIHAQLSLNFKTDGSTAGLLHLMMLPTNIESLSQDFVLATANVLQWIRVQRDCLTIQSTFVILSQLYTDVKCSPGHHNWEVPHAHKPDYLNLYPNSQQNQLWLSPICLRDCPVPAVLKVYLNPHPSHQWTQPWMSHVWAQDHLVPVTFKFHNSVVITSLQEPLQGLVRQHRR